jgi:hypothetical protein
MLLPIRGDRKPYTVLREPFIKSVARFSPDMKWFAYVSERFGREDVFVEPFPQSGAKWRISVGGGWLPKWRRDGKELFYLAADGALMSVPVAADGQSFRPGVPETLFQTGFNAVGSQNSVGSKISHLRPIERNRTESNKVTRTVREPFVPTLEQVIGHTDNICENDSHLAEPSSGRKILTGSPDDRGGDPFSRRRPRRKADSLFW